MKAPASGAAAERLPRFTTEGRLWTLKQLLPGQAIDLPLPPLTLGRRIVYGRIQSDAFAAFGAGGYTMRADGPYVRVTRLNAPASRGT